MRQFSAACLLLAILLALLADHAAAAPAAWVEWDRASDHVVSLPGETGAAYPRARQLSNGEILLAYHYGEPLGNCGSHVTLRHSRDNGATWYKTQEIDGPNERGFWGFCNPDFIELGRGRLMLVSAARGKADRSESDEFLSECKHSALRVRFSSDYGLTWGPPRMVAAGRGRVWEPSIARLPSGELQIFYANESPEIQADDASQCIEVIRSTDDGKTWSAPELVSERRGCRTGMPTALALANGHVVCGQEVVGLASSPWLADTVRGRTQNYRLAQDRYEFGAAPFLARAPDGGTLLIFHSQCLQAYPFKHLSGAWLFSQIYVQRGDADAENFGPASCPWPPSGTQGSGAFFPSVMTLQDGSLVAMASFITLHPDRTTSTVVRWIKGRLVAGKSVAAAELPGNHAEYKYGPPDEPGR